MSLTLLSGLCAMLLLAVPAGLEVRGLAAGVRVIGLLLPPGEPTAASLRNGATLAVLDANAAGGSNRLVIRGRRGPWGADGVEAARMVTDDEAGGLIAPPDGAATHLALQVSGRTAVPMVLLSPDASVTRAGIPWAVRVVPSTREEARVLFGCTPAKSWVALVTDDRPGREWSRDTGAMAEEVGVRFRSIALTEDGGRQPDRVARKLMEGGADGILLAVDAKLAGLVLRAVKAAGFSGVTGGPGRLRSLGFLNVADAAANGFLVAAPVVDGGGGHGFAGRYRQRFGEDPDDAAAYAYDAAALLLEVLGKMEGRSMVETLPWVTPFSGASGVLTFDSEGNRRSNLQVWIARDRGFVLRGAAPKP